MLKIIGNDIYRGGEKIGWVESGHIFAKDGKKLGYFSGEAVFDPLGNKLAYISGDFLYAQSGKTKIPLEKISEEIVGGVFEEIAKGAIFVLLGD